MREEAEIEEFFHSYRDRYNAALASGKADVEGTAAAFASCFIEANPFGVTCGSNDDSFRAVIPKGYEMYRRMGTLP